MTWSDSKAARELDFAEALAGLPLVAAAFDEGRIDYGKAWVFTDTLTTAELTGEQLQALCAAFVPAATALTAGQLRHRLLRAILAIDPHAAARRYHRAVTRRQVVGYLAADGTAVITASGLPADEAAAACARVDHVADHLHRRGYPGTITQVRAEVFLRLLDGRLSGLTTDQIITTLLTGTTTDADTTHADTTGGAGPSSTATGDPADNASDAPACAHAVTTTTSVEAADGAAACGANDPDRIGDETDHETSDETGEAATTAVGDPTGRADTAVTGGPTGEQVTAARRGGPAGVEIRVGLATLLGLDHRPGEIPGWGPVLPDTARHLVTRQHRAPWRFAIVDDDGHLLLAGLTRHRPHPTQAATATPRSAAGQPGPAQAEGGLVKLHVTATLLTALAHDPGLFPAWAALITDLARRYTDRHRLLAALDAHPDSRHARGPLLRHIQVRDRTCTAPGCRRPAYRCPTDHTHDWALGGPTTIANTGPLCARHHALKHHAGWQLRQPRPGWFHWTSPLGEHYTTRGEPVMPPLPEPCPPPLGSETPTAETPTAETPTAETPTAETLAAQPPKTAPPTAGPRHLGGPTFQTRAPQPRPADPTPPPRRFFWTHHPPENPDDPAPF